MRKNPGAGPRQRLVPSISDAEWAVMRVLWERGAATANEVVDAVASGRRWKPKTVHTLLRRLVDKKALTADRRGREYVFRPRVAERDCQLAEGRSFLSRVFGGEIAPFLAAFVEREELTPVEIEELKRILERSR
jgi:BlaI family penicillinase repressor